MTVVVVMKTMVVRVNKTYSILGNKVYNAPLTPGQSYRIQQRNYAASGNAESLGWVSVTTAPKPSETPTGIIVGVVLAVVVVALIVGGVYFYRKCKKKLVEYDEDEEGAIQLRNQSRSHFGTFMAKSRRVVPISGIGKDVASSFAIRLS